MEENEGFRLRDIVAGLWRRKWIIVAFTVLGALLGAGYYATAGKSYEGDAQVVVQAITGDRFASNARPQDSVNLTTETNLLTSSSVADEVKKRIKSTATSDQLLDRVKVVNPENSFTLNIAFKASDPKTAAAGANEFAKVYLDRRQQQAQDTVDRSVKDLGTQLAQLQTQLQQSVQIQDSTLKGTTENSAAVADGQSIQARIASLETQRTNLLSVDTTPGEIARTASVPSKPSGTPKWIMAFGIFLFVTLLGFVVALVLDLLDPTVRSVEELQRLLPAASIEMLPAAKLADAPERRAEAMARLAIRLGGAAGNSSAAVQIASTTVNAPERTTIDLVRTFTGAGRRTLVVWTGPVDACPAPKSIRSPLLGQVLRGSISLPDAIDGSESDAGEAWLVASVPTELSALLRPNSARSLIDAAAQEGFDVTIFSTPSPVHQAAALGVARNVDAVVLVAEEPKPQRRPLVATLKILNEERVDTTELVVG